MTRYIFIISFVAILSCCLNAQWQILNEGEKRDYNHPIDFVNDDVGWMIDGDNHLLKTEDFGVTWSEINMTELISNENTYISNLDFLDETTGWVVIINLLIPGRRSSIYFTRDSGITWQIKFTSLSIEVTRVFAIDSQNVYAWGARGYLIKTNDGGENWTDVSFLEPSNDDTEQMRAINFLNSDIGVAYGRRKRGPTYIVRTFDGGQTWKEQTVNLEWMDNLQFINDSTAYFTAYDENAFHFYETTDTLRTWTVKNGNNSIKFIDTYTLISADTIYALGYTDSNYSYHILVSIDGGATWYKRLLTFTGGYTDYNIYLNNKSQGLVTFPEGRTSFRSNDNGENWELTRLATPFVQTHFVNNSKGFAVSKRGQGDLVFGPRGDIFLTNDGGKNWELIYSGRPVLALQFVNENTGYFLTDNKLWETSDGGNNWNVSYMWEYTGFPEFSKNDMHFINENSGFIVGTYIDYDETNDTYLTQAKIIETSDGGETWVESWSSSNNALHTIYFRNSMGWAAGENGMIVKHTAENQWQQLPAVTDITLNDIFFIDENHGWIVGRGGDYPFNYAILRTTDGGESWQVKDDFDYGINDIYFENKFHGWAVGYSNTIIDGSIWPGNGVILETLDGGESWSVQVDDLPAPLTAMYSKARNIWVVGDLGIILKAEGVTWIDQSSGEVYPNRYNLSQNYPNPFNPTTKINYSIPKRGNVAIKIYDMLGEEITNLVNEEKYAGNYEVIFDGSNIPSGIYFYRLISGNYSATKKMVILK